jgi:hypothetical protein
MALASRFHGLQDGFSLHVPRHNFEEDPFAIILEVVCSQKIIIIIIITYIVFLAVS